MNARELLRRDAGWSLYALGDLDPKRAHHCEWRIRGENATLLYRAFETPILFATGELPVAELTDREYLLHLKREQVEALASRYEVQPSPVWRMILREPRLAAGGGAEALAAADAEALGALYADGEECGESPDFYMPEMLEEGGFYGIREGGALVAAAGTHLLSETEGVAAVGNVYTRRDRRGRGLAAAVTSAVIRGLGARGIGLIGLNVRQNNAGARRVYERLGFVVHCEFFEGTARRL